MDLTQTRRGVLSHMRPLPVSPNGTPRWEIKIGHVVCCTAPNSELAHKVPTYYGREVSAKFKMHYGKLTLASIRKSRT